MTTKFVVINKCYGGFPNDMEREYNSIEEFENNLKRLENLTAEEVSRDYNDWHPLMCSNPVLYEVELADDEYYDINEYDGMESLSFYKKGGIKSKAIQVARKS